MKSSNSKTIAVVILFLQSAFSVNSYGQTPNDIDPSEFYYIVEEMPKLKSGGDLLQGFKSIIQENFTVSEPMVCPVPTLYFSLIVSYEGKITNKEVLIRNSSDRCAEDIKKLKEAGLEALNQLPECIPGKHKGKRANVKFTIPMHIHLQ